MFDSFMTGLSLVLSFPGFLYLLAGIAVGLWLGVVPGLGGVTGMVVLLPLTFGMDPAAGLAMLLGMFAVVSTSDTITSVMLGIPGTIASQATVIDGNAMAKRGLAQTAFGAAFVSSAFGGVLGGLAMAASLPFALAIILAFGSPEFFLLSVLGLLMVGAVSGNAVSKGLGAAVLGLMLSQIGYPVASSMPRYFFGERSLLDGLPLVPVILGLFGLPEMMDLAARRTAIAHLNDEHTPDDSIFSGVRAAIRNRWLVIRCSLLGVYVGMLPAIGSSVVDWLAYGHATQSCKTDPQFGKGDVRGVIAPEAANNAVLGGSLIPTLAFGIPGSGAMAVLLGALTIHGFSPGRNMLSDNLDITFSMVWTIIIANIIGAAALMMWGRQVARAAFVDGNFIVPAVILFIFMGSWVWQPGMFTWITLLGVGLLGYIMKAAGWPRPPFILGFVLGPVLENAMSITWQSYTVMEVVTRPTVIGLVIVLALVFFFALRSTRRGLAAHAIEDTQESKASLILSAALALVLIALFGAAVWMARDWKLLAKVSPMAFGLAGIVIMGFVLFQDRNRLRVIAAARRAGDAAAGGTTRQFIAAHQRQIITFLSIALMAALTPWVGTYAAILGFAAIYTALWGRFRWWVVALYTAGLGAVLYFLYGRLLHAPFELPFFM
ncbi:tripartite tricarboxylate transporter permease [Martelella lutilitoris]|uniref:Tripartite tricarboxylate transporter permease n=1 Tax=Martelella lutilitoris TaxID=2583532 RepID=A0A7T7KLI2_9HYPH|nr:tripartite tricarboxylate transporter permease [Martelella lutilitoris]QQM30725.1 tripartite tricarboxylate transporter permease [Martelella lutilitoris]